MTPLSSSSSRGEAHRAHVPHEENEPDLVLVCAPLSADETVTAARRRQTAHDDNTVRTKQRKEDEQEEEEKEKKKQQARLFFVFVATTIVIAARDSFFLASTQAKKVNLKKRERVLVVLRKIFSKLEGFRVSVSRGGACATFGFRIKKRGVCTSSVHTTHAHIKQTNEQTNERIE
jgi:hypothetical protein